MTSDPIDDRDVGSEGIDTVDEGAEEEVSSCIDGASSILEGIAEVTMVDVDVDVDVGVSAEDGEVRVRVEVAKAAEEVETEEEVESLVEDFVEMRRPLAAAPV